MEGISASYGIPVIALSLALGVTGTVVSAILFFRLRKIETGIVALLRGKSGADLEEIVIRQKEGLDSLDEEIRKLYGIAEQLYRLGNESIHKTELLRFNPFKEVGGNQSFALALLNGKNTGFVLSSIHTREGTRVYAKPVGNGAEVQGYPLSEEERNAIGSAVRKRSAAFTEKTRKKED